VAQQAILVGRGWSRLNITIKPLQTDISVFPNQVLDIGISASLTLLDQNCKLNGKVKFCICICKSRNESTMFYVP